MRRLARRDGISMSAKARDLVTRALEDEGDATLVALAEQRERTFRRRAALSHRQVWAATPRR